MKASDDTKLVVSAILTLAASLEASEEQGTRREVAREQGLKKVIETFQKIFAQQNDQ